MAVDRPLDPEEAFEREVRAALRRRTGDPGAGSDRLRVAVDGPSPIDGHRQRVLAVLCLVFISLIATVVSQLA